MSRRRFRALRRARFFLIAGTWLAGLLMGAGLMTLAVLAYAAERNGALVAPHGSSVSDVEPLGFGNDSKNIDVVHSNKVYTPRAP